MLYALEMGEAEKSIIQQCRRSKAPLPDRIKNAPSLLLGLDAVWEAFWELSTCRSYGMSAGTIPWTAINTYAEVHDIDDEDFSALIRAMDVAFVGYSNEKTKAKG